MRSIQRLRRLIIAFLPFRMLIITPLPPLSVHNLPARPGPAHSTPIITASFRPDTWSHNLAPTDDIATTSQCRRSRNERSGAQVVNSRRESDAGIYWCEAKNELGVARSRNATLQVAGESTSRADRAGSPPSPSPPGPTLSGMHVCRAPSAIMCRSAIMCVCAHIFYLIYIIMLE